MSQTWIRHVIFEDEAGERYYGDEYEVLIQSSEIRRDRMRAPPQRTTIIRLEGEPVAAIGRSVRKQSDGTYFLVRLNKIVREVPE